MKPAPKVLLDLQQYFVHSDPFSNFEYHPTGSAYTCTPPIETTDIDWIVNVADFLDEIQAALSADFWEMHYDGEQHYSDCLSYRKGDHNIILCMYPDYYFSWKKATEICKYLNIQSKTVRKAIHRINCGEDEC